MAGTDLQEVDTQTILGNLYSRHLGSVAGKGRKNRKNIRRIRTRDIVLKMVQKGKSDEEIMELTECSAQLLWEVKTEMMRF